MQKTQYEEPGPLSFFLKILAAAVLLGACYILLRVVSADALEVPRGAIPVGIQPLPCGVYLQFYDGNQDLEDGVEFVAIGVLGEETHRAVIEYHSGDEGTFKGAKVEIPGEAIQSFATSEELFKAYPGPCSIAVKEGKLKT